MAQELENAVDRKKLCPFWMEKDGDNVRIERD
jgi:hypothetical protein